MCVLLVSDVFSRAPQRACRDGSMLTEPACVADGDFSAIDLTAGDYARMADLVTTYGSLPLGTTGASVIALAERFRLTEVATLDRRHFTVVRPIHANALTLLP
jgi:uncharacterized protein